MRKQLQKLRGSNFAIKVNREDIDELVKMAQEEGYTYVMEKSKVQWWEVNKDLGTYMVFYNDYECSIHAHEGMSSQIVLEFKH